MDNLADDHNYKGVINEMNGKLMDWMKACGDKGQQTEMEAMLHMPKWIKKDK